MNNAQDKYFAELTKLFEVDEDVRRALSELVETDSLTAEVSTPAGITPLSSASVFYAIGSVFDGTLYKIIEEYVTDASANRILAKPVTYDQYLANINNPFKKPYSDMVWRVDVAGYIEIIPIGVTPVNYVYRYLTKPTKIDYASDVVATLDLRDKDLKNIVDIAVADALNSLSVVKPGE
jgi:hypothetical protein